MEEINLVLAETESSHNPLRPILRFDVRLA